MLFLLIFLFFFPFLLLFSIFSFSLFFLIEVVQHNSVMLLGFFVIFLFFSLFPFFSFPVFFLLFHFNAETLFWFSCLNVSPTFFPLNVLAYIKFQYQVFL